ncbi:MAG: hypothetical protein H0T17_09000 [Propionibacteriales bacterium]|nr:hypothetical protein [Propionibacteriales bacterium]
MSNAAGIAPDRVFLHIGLHKTGTTFLQNLLAANRAQLRAKGVDYPGGEGEPVQAFAALDLQGRRPRGYNDRRVEGSWDAIVTAVHQRGLPTALISDERLSMSTLKQVRRAVASFPSSQVHVIVTARDLGRIAVSAWQEDIKSDETWTWQQFVAAVKDPAQLAKSPARGFWLRQDLPKICETWESAVGACRVHVVTVARTGSSPEELLHRFAGVVGFDPDILSESATWSNETVGVAATEVIRRVNERLGGRLNQREHDRAIKNTLVHMLAERTEPKRFTLPADDVSWARSRADEMIAALQERGYPVCGDLDELRVVFNEDGRRPDDASDHELLDAALDALALLAERYATSWWVRRKANIEAEPGKGSVRSKARGAVFRSQRRAAELADHSSVAAKAVGAVLKARDRARIKARDRARD